MYQKYFGLREPSFSIAPDPEYLYLSEQHREALAHLLYGASAAGGFVLLTGEVGTGKTTVCRAFLDQLPVEVEVALVLNPAVSGFELLRTICDELQISIAPEERSIKYLIDQLNLYLLDAHARGRRPVLMIDEAQALRPRVLELVRLLTNLETNKHKLLQIFLVGQPELRHVIDSDAMRQLRQRITARFHLGPLSAAETAAYIRHRLAVAGVDRPLFTPRAVRRVHALTGGVPRLINILCDRALLGACVRRSLLVTPRLVARAARELRGDERPRRRLAPPRPVFLLALLMTLVFAGVWLTRDRLAAGGEQELRRRLVAWLGEGLEDDLRRADRGTGPLAAAVGGDGAALIAPARQLAADPVITEPTDGQPLPQAAEENRSLVSLEPETQPEPAAWVMDREEALSLLLRRWGVEVTGFDGGSDPCQRIASFGLRCEEEEGDWGHVRFFNRPVLLRVSAAEGGDGFLVLGALADDIAILDRPDQTGRVPLSEINDLWTGEYLLIWQPPPVGVSMIGDGSSGESVRWLRKLLARVPGLELSDTDSGRFDAGLDAALRRFQAGRGLAADGVAGYRTLIQLHNVVDMPGVPKLIEVP